MVDLLFQPLNITKHAFQALDFALRQWPLNLQQEKDRNALSVLFLNFIHQANAFCDPQIKKSLVHRIRETHSAQVWKWAQEANPSIATQPVLLATKTSWEWYQKLISCNAHFFHPDPAVSGFLEIVQEIVKGFAPQHNKHSRSVEEGPCMKVPWGLLHRHKTYKMRIKKNAAKPRPFPPHRLLSLS